MMRAFAPLLLPIRLVIISTSVNPLLQRSPTRKCFHRPDDTRYRPSVDQVPQILKILASSVEVADQLKQFACRRDITANQGELSDLPKVSFHI